jgi:hypothetical protein
MADEVGEWFGEDDGFAAQMDPYSEFIGVDVVEGEAADGGRPLGVEETEQPGDAVFGFECVVVEQLAGLFPSSFGIDEAGWAAPADGSEVEAGQFLFLGPADEVPDVPAVGGVFIGQPGIQVALAGGSESEIVFGEPVEQGDGGLDVLLDHDGLVVRACPRTRVVRRGP